MLKPSFIGSIGLTVLIVVSLSGCSHSPTLSGPLGSERSAQIRTLVLQCWSENEGMAFFYGSGAVWIACIRSAARQTRLRFPTTAVSKGKI